jgi:HSP20 family protein
MSDKKSKREQAESRSVASWRPFEGLEPWPSFFGEGRFPRLLDEMFREWPGAARGRGLAPAMDVHEDEKQYAISVELPGVKKEDVHVELQEGALTIRGEKSSEREEKKEQRRYTERSYGSFSRSFRLPADADVERLDASFKDGVLTIAIPKTEEAKPRTIAIKSA